MLTTEEIQFIDNYLTNSEVDYFDIKMELLDHIAAAVEEKMEIDQLSFYDAFKAYMAVNKKELLKKNEKTRGFQFSGFLPFLRFLISKVGVAVLAVWSVCFYSFKSVFENLGQYTLFFSIGALIMLFAFIQLFIYRFKNKMRFYAVEKSGVVLFFVMQTNQIASTFFKYNETNPRLWFVYFMTTIIIIFSVFYFLELKKYTTIYKKQLQ